MTSASASAARLLSRSLLAIVCGAAACSEGGEDESTNGAALGDTGVAGSAGAAAAGSGGTGALGGTGGSTNGAGGSLGIAGRGGARAAVCDGASPFVVDGRDSGLDACADGTYARVAAGQCRLPDGFSAPGCPVHVGGSGGGSAGAGGGGACDARCDDAPYGVFLNQQTKSVIYCRYHCEADADCPQGNVCVCGADGVGMCGYAECKTAADCETGESCRVKVDPRHCSPGLGVALVCYGAGDECLRDTDCPTNTAAFPDGGPMSCDRSTRPDGTSGRFCHGPYACGRPIVLADAVLLAPLHRGLTPWARDPVPRC